MTSGLASGQCRKKQRGPLRGCRLTGVKKLSHTLRGLQYFLYRRLSGLGILAARLQRDSAAIWLSDKFQVASFQDVFLDPNYWRAFSLIERAPRLIIDCGAHCGHFAILVDLCIRARFGASEAKYILLEPNAALHPSLKRNIADAGMAERTTIVRGFVGAKHGTAELQTNVKNHLIGHAIKGGTGEQIAYIDLDALIDRAEIDVLKLDIEGSEFEFAEHNQNLMSRCSLIVAEIHPASGSVDSFVHLLKGAGLELDGPVVAAGENVVAWFSQGERLRA